MSTNQRLLDPARTFRGEGGNEGPGPDDGLDATRREARDLASAGRSAILRALSGDSLTFLRSVRQLGGE